MRRLRVYANNSRAIVLAALQAAFPVVMRLGGEAWFSQSAARYQCAIPSHSGNAQDLGERYPAFLRSEFRGSEYRYFADVARLEWAYQLVLRAADLPALNLDVLRGIAPEDYERLVLIPRPALQLMRSPYPVIAIWRAHQIPTVDEVPMRCAESASSRVLLIRRPTYVEFRELPPRTYRLLQQCQLGRTLGSIAAGLPTDAPSTALRDAMIETITLQTIAKINLSANL